MTSVKRFVAPMGEWFFKTSIARAEKQKDKWCSKLTRKDWDKSPSLPQPIHSSILYSCHLTDIWWQAVQEGWPRLSFSSVIHRDFLGFIFVSCLGHVFWYFILFSWINIGYGGWIYIEQNYGSCSLQLLPSFLFLSLVLQHGWIQFCPK